MIDQIYLSHLSLVVQGGAETKKKGIEKFIKTQYIEDNDNCVASLYSRRNLSIEMRRTRSNPTIQ